MAAVPLHQDRSESLCELSENEDSLSVENLADPFPELDVSLPGSPHKRINLKQISRSTSVETNPPKGKNMHRPLRKAPSAPPTIRFQSNLQVALSNDMITHQGDSLSELSSDWSMNGSPSDEHVVHPWDPGYKRKTCIVKLDGCKYTIGFTRMLGGTEAVVSQVERGELEAWKKSRLEEWLRCRGAKCTGNKNALVNRVWQIMQTGSHPTQEKEKSSKSHPIYCCVPHCHNTSGKVLPDGNQATLHRIPADDQVRRRWIARLRNVRKNLVVNSNTRVCNVHFVDNDVTNEPTIFPSKPPKELKKRRILQRKIPDMPLSGSTYSDHPVSVDDNQNYIHSGDLFDLCRSCRQMLVKAVDVGTQCSEPITTVTVETQTSFNSSGTPDLQFEDLAQSDEKVRFYTGFVNYAMFLAMFQTLLSHGADKLNYWRGEKSMGERSYHEKGRKPGPKRTLRLQDEFFLVCLRLRLGLMQEHLSDIFKVSISTVSRTLNTWINFIYDASQKLVPWPNKQQILYNLPRAFVDFPSTQIILDCTEIFIEKPSSHVAQWQTWSDYKQHNTLKVLIGVTPNGTVNFISRLWGGRASDRHITMNEGVIPMIDPGMVIMADKGFTIEDLLPESVSLNMPPRIPSSRPMTESEVFTTQHIASSRIVVEMKMEQAKNYRCLQGILPLSEVHLIEQMTFICFAWTNLLPPLFKR